MPTFLQATNYRVMFKWTPCRSIAFLGLIVSAHGAFEECGSILMVEGNLQSHGYPNSYPPKFTCDWTIQAGPEDTVDMRFMDFDVEESPQCRYDYVQIFAMGYSPKYCGRGVEKVGRGGILSVTGEVKIVLKSDAADQFKGFSMQYKVTPEEPPTEPPEPTESPIPIDPDSVTCADEPCQNGADCIDVEIGEVVCFCADGFEGDFCEINIDECESTPCENGGTCIDGVNDVTCECPPGFIGQFCTVDLDECQAEPCQNGGTCIDGANSFECICAEGYTSWNCGQEINECDSSPCLNMGVCEDLLGGYECICYPGYTGFNCEIEPTTAATTTTTVQTTTTTKSIALTTADNRDSITPAEHFPDAVLPTESPSPQHSESLPEITQPTPEDSQSKKPIAAADLGQLIDETTTLHSEVSTAKNFKSEGPQTSANANYSSATYDTTALIEEDSEKQDGDANASETSSSSSYVIAGVIVGILALLALAALIYYLKFRKTVKTKVQPTMDLLKDARETANSDDVKDGKSEQNDFEDKNIKFSKKGIKFWK